MFPPQGIRLVKAPFKATFLSLELAKEKRKPRKPPPKRGL
jgi:hypothetical protein